MGAQFYDHNPHTTEKGGRNSAIEILKNFKFLREYQRIRDNPNLKTSQLSGHNKFGTVSIREVFYTSKSKLKDTAERFIS